MKTLADRFAVAAMVLARFIPLSLDLSCAGIFYPAFGLPWRQARHAVVLHVTLLMSAIIVAIVNSGHMQSKAERRLIAASARNGAYAMR